MPQTFKLNSSEIRFRNSNKMHPAEFQSETLAQNRIPSNEKLIRKIDTLSTPSQAKDTLRSTYHFTFFCVEYCINGLPGEGG